MMADGSRCDPEVEDMEAGVARQCSGNRCLARWTVWIRHRGRGGGAGRAHSKKDLLSGPDRGYLCPTGRRIDWRPAPCDTRHRPAVWWRMPEGDHLTKYKGTLRPSTVSAWDGEVSGSLRGVRHREARGPSRRLAGPGRRRRERVGRVPGWPVTRTWSRCATHDASAHHSRLGTVALT